MAKTTFTLTQTQLQFNWRLYIYIGIICWCVFFSFFFHSFVLLLFFRQPPCRTFLWLWIINRMETRVTFINLISLKRNEKQLNVAELVERQDRQFVFVPIYLYVDDDLWFIATIFMRSLIIATDWTANKLLFHFRNVIFVKFRSSVQIQWISNRKFMTDFSNGFYSLRARICNNLSFVRFHVVCVVVHRAFTHSLRQTKGEKCGPINGQSIDVNDSYDRRSINSYMHNLFNNIP